MRFSEINRGAKNCRRKREFKTRAAAMAFKKRVKRKIKGSQYRVYQCPYCLCWHLTKRRDRPFPEPEVEQSEEEQENNYE